MAFLAIGDTSSAAFVGKKIDEKPFIIKLMSWIHSKINDFWRKWQRHANVNTLNGDQVPLSL